MAANHDSFINGCVAIDIEVDPSKSKMFDLAVIRGKPPNHVNFRTRDVDEFLRRLEQMIEPTDFLVGHNIIQYDLEHLIAERPGATKYLRRAIDTLWLSPLAYPEDKSHRLKKPYLDGRLKGGRKQNPVEDAKLALRKLENELEAFCGSSPEQLVAYHFLATCSQNSEGFDGLFTYLRNAKTPGIENAREAVWKILDGRACVRYCEELIAEIDNPTNSWPLAYVLSRVPYTEGESILPPWVAKSFKKAKKMMRDVRATRCELLSCGWCSKYLEPRVALKQWFGHSSYKAEPKDVAGNSLQGRIVNEVVNGKSLLGILPTGTGKSICFQIPALLKYRATGALTVVISPLVALMTDQIEGLTKKGIDSAVTVSGGPSPFDRSLVLDRIRIGEASMLYISPEQLRNSSIQSALRYREIDLWVFDEAHCISKWGHDFRPDYRYVSRYIKDSSGDEFSGQILCLTATAKPDVRLDIQNHFRDRLGIELFEFNGGVERTNLQFKVQKTTEKTKPTHIRELINKEILTEENSGAIVYCATINETETIAGYLSSTGLAAAFFHSKVPLEKKKEVQTGFREGEVRVVVATNAFGMGIDKPNVRLVVHATIPGSLENYLQEAGRAGRDGESANCVLLYDKNDIETQFKLIARSRLSQREIGAILKSIRRLEKKQKTVDGKVVATPEEIVREEIDKEFARDSATDDTRVKTAVSWLEEAKLLTRDENRVDVSPESLKIETITEAETKFEEEKYSVTKSWQKTLLTITGHLLESNDKEGTSTDELMRVSGLSRGRLNQALYDLEMVGILKNDLPVTILVSKGVSNHSDERMREMRDLEIGMIGLMREKAPDADCSTWQKLNLQEFSQGLRDEGHKNVRPDKIKRLVQSLAWDGYDDEEKKGSIRKKFLDRNTISIKLQESWDLLERRAKLRQEGAAVLLDSFLGRVERGKRGKDIEIEVTLGDLLDHLKLLYQDRVNSLVKFMERSLMWMHEQQILTITRGLTIFRPAITIKVRSGKDLNFTEEHFRPLAEYYKEQTLQIHIMSRYAECGLENTKTELANKLAQDYFVFDRIKFVDTWLPGKKSDWSIQTTRETYKRIVKDLNNPTQQDIVTDDRVQTNVLVLAGPGSGKTRVLVHRIAYLVRVRREDPNSILALAYNRHAATEIKKRLRELILDDAAGVTVQTFHAFAMKVLGLSFEKLATEKPDFKTVIAEAVNLIEGSGLDKDEAEARRETLIPGYRWMFVDEYQDIDLEKYELISAIAGRSLNDKELKLSLFAVGDDDQNIYAYDGASVKHIRQFEQDYKTKPNYLLENYRSTANIIDAANAVISLADDRLKRGHDIVINRDRDKDPHGGELEFEDSVARGRVQVIQCPLGRREQSVVAVKELIRLSKFERDWSWSRAAIITRRWEDLQYARAYAEYLNIPVTLATDKPLNIWRLRETQALLTEIQCSQKTELAVSDLLNCLNKVVNSLGRNKWIDLLKQGIEILGDEIGGKSMALEETREWLAEWSKEAREALQGLSLLVAHRAKGLEFDHVVILDGSWRGKLSGKEDKDSPRRLYYVAMTRACRSLTMITRYRHPFVTNSPKNVIYKKIIPDEVDYISLKRKYEVPSLKMVNLGYAGRICNSDISLIAISEAKVGDMVSIVPNEINVWEIRDQRGRQLGTMAKKNFKVPDRFEIEKAKIGAIWTRSKSEESNPEKMKRVSWEVVLPEIVYKGRNVSTYR